MSDCLQNEDSIVSDLSSSNADSLTGTLDSGDNINSDISIDDAMASSISDGDSTDSNLGDDGSLYSELSLGGGGGAKYTGQETDSIVVTVDNNVYTISASLKPIKFDSVADFPLVGSEKLIYVDFSNKALYGWDSTKGVYYKLVADVKVPTKLSEFTNDAGFITNTVNNLVEYYKKTETYTQEEIDSKISAIPKFAIKVVTELPTTDISETTVYLVASGSDNQNLYIEYIYVDGVWEKLGEQTLDLSNVVNSINGKTGDVELTAEDVGALPSNTSLFSGDYNDLSNKPTIPTNNNQLTNGAGYITGIRDVGQAIRFKAKNNIFYDIYGDSATGALYAYVNNPEGSNGWYKFLDQNGTLYSKNGEVAVKDDIPTDYLPDTTRYGASIDLSINNTTYVVTAQLKDQNGNNIGDAKTIDLPLESVVVSGSYDATNKKVILTLKDGSKIDFSVADLVSGLQKEITSTNKLSVNLIDGIDNYALKSVVDGVKTEASNAYALARSNRSDISTLQSNQYTGSTYYYGTSSTDATTAIKIVECPKFKLVAGARISVLFENSNEATLPQLNVNSTGNIYIAHQKDTNGYLTDASNWWKKGQVVDFVYDGSAFIITNAGGGGTKIIWREWT